MIADELISRLSKLRNQHVHFFPNTGNAGDGYISYVTLQLMRSFAIKYTMCGPRETVGKDTTVIFGGGGNLIEGKYRTLYDTINRNINGNVAILLPHTISGYLDLLDHPNLEIFVRDPVSYSILRPKHSKSKAKVVLAHDMTFYSEPSLFQRFQKAGSGTFICLRNDIEKASHVTHPDNQDISLSWNGSWWTNEDLCQFSTESLAAAISPFNLVATDRLHIAILSAHLGKTVIFTGNNYFKNEAVFQHSLSRFFPTVEFLPSRQSVLDRINSM